MKAKNMVKKLGKKLIGKEIVTEPYGEWPGGIATVVDLGHDPEAPEIVMNVTAPFWPHGSMGVFEHENVRLHDGTRNVRT